MGKNLQNNETNSSLDALKKRYQQRGLNYHASAEYINQDSKEVHTRALAPAAYNAKGADEYKSGGHGDQRYMTEGDFASYYSEKRTYTPEPNVNFDTAVALKEIDQKRYGKKTEENINNILSENNRQESLRKRLEQNSAEQKVTQTESGIIIREKKKGVVSYKEEAPKTPIKEKAKRAYEEWVPLEERKKEKCIEGKKTKMPKTLIFAIITIAVSLLLIVGSTVMLTMAKKEQSSLESELSALIDSEKLLEQKLDEKNSKLGIEEYAQEELGMISRDYVDVEYIKNEKGDGLEMNKEEKTSASLLEAIISLFK